MATHTKPRTSPWPWTYDRAAGQVDCPGGTVVQPNAISWVPDAILIAAAPELLSALDALVWAVEELRSGKEIPVGRKLTISIKVDEARAAIAKARGEVGPESLERARAVAASIVSACNAIQRRLDVVPIASLAPDPEPVH